MQAENRKSSVGFLFVRSDYLNKLLVQFLDPISQRAGNMCRHKGRKIAIPVSDLFDERCRDKRQMLIGHQEDGVDIGGQPPVRERHPKLIFKIRELAYTPDQGLGLLLFCKINQKPGKLFNLNIL